VCAAGALLLGLVPAFDAALSLALAGALLLGLGLGAGVLRHRARAERYLGASREREERFLSLLGIAADAYWELDAQYRLALLSRRDHDGVFVAETLDGLCEPWEMPHLLFDDETLDELRADLEARLPFRDVALRAVTRSGAVAHLTVSGEPRFDSRGAFVGYWGVARDITEHERARGALQTSEDAVRRSQALLSHLVATSPDVITLSDVATGRYAMVNDTFARLTGYTQAEVMGRTSSELGIWDRPEDRERLVSELREYGTVKDLPTEFVGKWGQRLAMRVSAARFAMDGDAYLVINARDVTGTEHVRLEREAILENASIGIALTRDQRFQVANPTFEAMFGWEPGTLVGQSGREVWTSDDDYGRFGRDIGPKLARGDQVEFENLMARRDGTTFLCRLLARAVDPTHPSRGGTIWIAEDVTERRRIEQALAKARDDAEAASRAKSAFLANTSHEIRTPLNGLVGLARLARQPGIDETRRRQYLDQIFDSAQTLSTIISDILDLSKIEAGKLNIDAVPFDLRELLDTLHKGYKHLADARALALDLQVAPDLPAVVLGDPMRVRQIVSNYLANALKFTSRGGVCLAARAIAGDRVRFEVHDSGPGIDAATQALLFHPFTQADQSTTRRYGGTGLGLSICRQLAALMDGEVGVDSSPGAGSCFWAELALPASDVPVQPSFFGALDGGPIAGASVLMVEDNPVNMMIAVALLEQWGATVTQASNGQQAVDAVRRSAQGGHLFDAVLMDVQMPVMSGHEATRILRREHDPRSLPIIALTAAALTSEREAALTAGMNDFLTKPIDSQRLHDTLVKVL